MSSEEEEPELPVAAYEWRYVDWEDGHTVLRHEEPDRNSFDVELELVGELVKKSEAEEAIREAREEAYNKGFNEATQEATEVLLEELEEREEEVDES